MCPNQLDQNSVLMCSYYFKSTADFINLICVNSKFKETTEKLLYNPIPINSTKLFPNIQTQYLYAGNNPIINTIPIHEIWYEVDYYQSTLFKHYGIKCHHIKYTQDDLIQNSEEYGYSIPNNITILDEKCYDCCEVESLTIPTTVTSIRNKCFYCCENLVSISLPNTLTRISEYCFSSCESLKSITLPSSVEILENYCFYCCEELQTINIPNSVTKIKSGSFSYCNSLQSITLPTSLTMLEEYTFDNCSSLTQIELSNSLALIGNACFFNCPDLQTIILPTTLKHIGNECFRDCLSLKKIEIPNSVQFIGIDCFFNCTSLTDMKFQSHINEFTFKVSYNDSILYKKYGITCNNIILTQSDVMSNLLPKINNSYGITECIIPNGIVEIDCKAFDVTNTVQSIIIPTTVTSIGNNCFVGCKSLTSLSIPSGIKKIGMNCFERCLKLKEVILPTQFQNKYPFKVTYNDYLILNKCNIHCSKVLFTNLEFNQNKLIPTEIPVILKIATIFGKTKEMLIHDNVISLKINHLSKDITTIEIPTSVTKLCDNCFKDYPKLQSITIPTTVQCIGKHLIDGCTSLTKLNYEGDWNNIVVSYDDYLRYKSIGLIFNSIEYTKEDINKYGNVIPTIVNSLQNSCYEKSFNEFNIPTHITSLDNRMFETFFNGFLCIKEFSLLRSISIPNSIQTIPKYCFGECKFLVNVSLPSTLTIIKKKAFYKCISLQSIIIPPSVVTIEQYAFDDCYSLTRVTFPTPLPTLGIGCFKGCVELRSNANIPTNAF